MRQVSFNTLQPTSRAGQRFTIPIKTAAASSLLGLGTRWKNQNNPLISNNLGEHKQSQHVPVLNDGIYENPRINTATDPDILVKGKKYPLLHTHFRSLFCSFRSSVGTGAWRLQHVYRRRKVERINPSDPGAYRKGESKYNRPAGTP